MNQEVVNLIGKDDQLMIDSVSPQQLDEAGRLPEGHVSIVISMNEQDGRFPLFDLRNRRRLIGNALGIK